MALAKIIRPLAFSIPYEMLITHDECCIVEPGTLNNICDVRVTVKGKSDEDLFAEICKLINIKGNFTCIGFRDYRV